MTDNIDKEKLSASASTKQKDAEELLSIIENLVAELHPQGLRNQSIDLDSPFDKKLGLDSLSRVELIQRVETAFQIKLDNQIFAQANCGNHLLSALMSKRGLSADIDTRVFKQTPLATVERHPQYVNTLIEALNWHQEQHPQRRHIVFYKDQVEDEFDGDSITFGELANRSYQIAWGLLDHGLKRGVKVAIMLPTCSDYFYSFMGVIAAGGIAVPVYPPVRMAQIENYIQRHRAILANCQAEIMLTTPEVKRFSSLVKSLIPGLRLVASPEDFTHYPQKATDIPLNGEDVAFIQYTSGSTSDPKGVQLTHANLLANIRAMGQAAALKSNDIFVSWLPLYHDMGLIGAWLGNFYHSANLVIMSPIEFLMRPYRWLWAIHRYRATISAAPNFAYDLCLHKISDEQIDGLDLSSWRLALNGAEPVIPTVIRNFSQRFSSYGFEQKSMWPVYGLAESSVGLAFPKADKTPQIDRIKRQAFIERGTAILATDDEPNALEFVGCGQALPGHEIRVIDNMGFQLPDRMEGHLQFKGPSSTIGYYRNDEQNQRLFKGEWLDTGDLAYLDKGVLFLTGRTKDIIIRGGRNIYPQELEDIIGYIDGIRRGRAVAFGYRDNLDGKEKLVIIAEKQRETASSDDELRQRIIAACTDIIDLPPDDIVFVQPNIILKTSSGKLRRSACKKLYLEKSINRKPKSIQWQLGRLFFSALKQQILRQWHSLINLMYALYCWLVYLLLASTSLIVFQLPFSGDFFQQMARRMVKLLVVLTRTDISVTGTEAIPSNRSFIFVANHSSYLDVYALLATLPTRFRFVAKAELSRNIWLKTTLKKLKVVFVERFDVAQSIADLEAIEAMNDPLLFFAEGTFQRRPGLQDFHLGAFITAVHNNLSIVPVSIRGTRDMLRSGSWFPRRGNIEVTVHPPMRDEKELGDPWYRANQLKEDTRKVILNACQEPDLR